MKKENKEINFEKVMNGINEFLEELEENEEEYEKFIELNKKIKDLNLNDERSLDAIHIIVSDIIAKNKVDNEKNIDTIQELVNIIREAIKYIEDSEYININKLLSILNQYEV